jgi:hypothetical protein
VAEDVEAPGSALSANVTVEGGGPGGDDTSFNVNRESRPESYSSTHKGDLTYVTPGKWPLRVTFYAEPSLAGAVVGEAYAEVDFADLSTPITIATVGKIASVEVAPNQALMVPETGRLEFSCGDEAGAILAVTPGSGAWAVTGGSSVLSVAVNGQAAGLAEGVGKVEVTVDGVASPAASIPVVAAPVPEEGSGFAYGESRAKALTGTPGEEVTDPLSGVTVVFPSGAEGLVVWSTCTEVPGAGASPEEVCVLQFPSDVPVTLRVPKTEGPAPPDPVMTV